MSVLGRECSRREVMRRHSVVWSDSHGGFVSFLEWMLLVALVVFAISNADHGVDLLKMLASLAQR